MYNRSAATAGGDADAFPDQDDDTPGAARFWRTRCAAIRAEAESHKREALVAESQRLSVTEALATAKRKISQLQETIKEMDASRPPLAVPLAQWVVEKKEAVTEAENARDR